MYPLLYFWLYIYKLRSDISHKQTVGQAHQEAVKQKVPLCNIPQSIEMLTSITGLQSIADVLPSLASLQTKSEN